MPKILVIQHAASEGPGTFEEEMKKAGLTWEIFMASDHAIFPSGTKLEEYNGFLILGGPMGVYEEKKHPWIQKEILIIKEMLRQKKPILSICLGAQLLAKAAGAQVTKGHQHEIGWLPIRLDDWFYKRNPLFFQIDPAKEHTVFQWHGDTFDIPVEGYRLAWNETYPNQAFCYQGNAIGLQFHVEMNEAMIKDWVSDEENRVKIMAAGGDPDKILSDIPKYLPTLQAMAHKIFYGFASLIRDNRRQAA
ncbi:MAG: gamma-glutamyl-gamma-aminobutyrate hydrolase family protein [Deltaproteobacteria bacterium]|nr:gamma-glutamyl-gamma-aminobutyrate hydrolase family protein [Deltaproteobacteria bacterium]